ncbi:MAG: hypothetical protein DWQ19_09080 [Crenarchaeota archaeon]|nr:MAG: hypothetical protein DWQ19_09080 [Thermoproteota archaeon]
MTIYHMTIYHILTGAAVIAIIVLLRKAIHKMDCKAEQQRYEEIRDSIPESITVGPHKPKVPHWKNRISKYYPED